MDEKGRVLYGRFGKLFFRFHNPFARLLCNLSRKKQEKSLPDTPKILLCCQASLGDVVLAKQVIPELQKIFPGATFGFLCAPESVSVVQDDPRITRIHVSPSWRKPGRNPLGDLLTLCRYHFTFYRTLTTSIRRHRYDISIELHPFFPNSIPLCYRARVPRRIGFTSGGYVPFLTDPVPLPKSIGYLPTLYFSLLAPFGVQKKERIPFIRSDFDEKSIVIHPGSSDIRKFWKEDRWRELVRVLSKKGYRLRITGKGKQDAEHIAKAELSKFGEVLCDRIDFSDLQRYIAKAALLISVDSVPVHLAAESGTPFVALYLYTMSLELWIPDTPFCRLLVADRCRRLTDTKIPELQIATDFSVEQVLACVYDLLGTSRNR